MRENKLLSPTISFTFNATNYAKSLPQKNTKAGTGVTCCAFGVTCYAKFHPGIERCRTGV